MAQPLIPLPLPDLTGLIELFGAGLATFGAVKIGPPLVQGARQRAYDEVSQTEAVRLVVAPPSGLPPDPDLATELIRALHPRQRRGFDRWRVGWPSAELCVTRTDGQLAWAIDTNRQLAAQIEHALRALYPGTELAVTRPAMRQAAATAVGRLAVSSAWPLGEASSTAGRALNRLAAALERMPAGAEVRLRLLVRPVSPDAWRQQVSPPSVSGSVSMKQVIGTAIIDGLLFRESTLDEARKPPELAPEVREAQARKRRGVVGFDVGLVLEVAGVAADEAEALLWRLVDFTHPLGDGHQEIRWEIRRGPVANPPRARLADWELAQLWYLPDASFDRAGFVRDRPLAAPPPRRHGSLAERRSREPAPRRVAGSAAADPGGQPAQAPRRAGRDRLGQEHPAHEPGAGGDRGRHRHHRHRSPRRPRGGHPLPAPAPRERPGARAAPGRPGPSARLQLPRAA